MCGRFSQTAPPDVIAQEFSLDDPPLLTPRYNIAPSQPVAAIRLHPESAKRDCVLFRWGLIPSWAEDPAISIRMINARAETVAEKPAFRSAFRHRRCLVLADGFYEWRREGRTKQPFYIRKRDGGPFALAGLWEPWQSAEGVAVESCTILTTGANEAMAPIHDRMPVLLDPKDYALWLDPNIRQTEALLPLLRPVPSECLTLYPVSVWVNSPGHDDPQCLAPLSANEGPAMFPSQD
ncbi:MAG: SOS response-associated peptidase [Nitrospira sp.]|nr:SOS response-associated peptidase [Nitrospira sp.]